jgi:hypothetical protein
MDNNRIGISIDVLWVMAILVILLTFQTIISVMAISEARDARAEASQLKERIIRLDEVTDDLKENDADISRRTSLIRDELDLIEDLVAGDS